MANPDFFLARAVELARQGSQRGDGGPFGAVIVHNGQIIGEGWNRVLVSHDPTAHAEINAIRAASQHLQQFHLHDCILYTSSEPCPMCLAAAYWARIPHIVFANSRQAAAALGFCDAELYTVLTQAEPRSGPQLEQRPSPAASALFAEWAAAPQRTLY